MVSQAQTENQTSVFLGNVQIHPNWFSTDYLAIHPLSQKQLPRARRGALSGWPLDSHQPKGKMSMESTLTIHSGMGFLEPVQVREIFLDY